MQKYFKLIISAIVGFFTGAFVLIIIKKYGQFHLDATISFEINPFEILSLISTIVLAVYVAKTIAQQNDIVKSKKDLVTTYLSKYMDDLNVKVNFLLEQESFDAPVTNSYFKILRKRIDTIVNLATEYKFIDDNDVNARELKDKISSIWVNFTDTPKKSNGRSNAATKALDLLRLERVSKIENTLIDIERLVFVMTMEINRK